MGSGPSKSNKKGKRGRDVGTFFDENDMFRQNVNKFNIDRVEHVGTSIGFCATVFIWLLVITYACIKGKMMLLGEKPLVATFASKAARMTDNQQLSLGDLNFQMAFAVTTKNSDFSKQVAMHDPDKVEWQVSVKNYDESGSKSRTILKTHQCGDEDWKLFSPIRFFKKKQVDYMKNKGIFMCLDLKQKDHEGKPVALKDLKLYGQGRVSQNKLDFIYRPCMVRQWTQELEDTGAKCLVKDMTTDSPELKQRFKDTHAYLGKNALIYNYFNQEEFNPRMYDDKSINKSSELYFTQFETAHPSYTENMIKHDYVRDETAMFQVGQSDEKQYSAVEFNSNILPSSYSQYPYKYKFIGIEFSLDMDVQTTDRQTYGFLDFIGDLGGLSEILQLSVGWILYKLSSMRLSAIMINRLYHVSDDSQTKQLVKEMKMAASAKACQCCKSKQNVNKEVDPNFLVPGKLNKRQGGDIELDVPKYLDCEQAAYFFLSLCCLGKQVRAFGEYKQAVDLGRKGFSQDLDVVRFVRRMRAHGFGLHFLMKSSQRANAARLAYSRPLRATKVNTDSDCMAQQKDKWYAIENLQQTDKFMIMFFQKYGPKIYEVLDKPKKFIKHVEWQPGKSGYTDEQKAKLEHIMSKK